MYLEGIRMYIKSLKGFRGFQADHVSQDSEVRGMESGHKVGGSSDVQKDLDMACNSKNEKFLVGILLPLHFELAEHMLINVWLHFISTVCVVKVC